MYHVKNYYPRVLNREALLDPMAMQTLVQRYMDLFDVSQIKATEAIAQIIGNADEASRQAMAQDSVENAADHLDVANPYGGNARTRKLTNREYDQLFEGFIEQDIRAVFNHYLPQMIRMAEFNRLLGERSDDPAEWDPKAKLRRIIRGAQQEGMSPAETAELEDIIDTWLGRRGIAMSPTARKVSSWLMTYQNLRVLLFTVFASLPDVISSAIRADDLGVAVRAWRGYATSEFNREDMAAMARTWGIIADHLNQSAVADHFTANFMTPDAEAINDKFFRMTGLLMWTNFTRKLALGVGQQFIVEHAIEVQQNGTQESIDKLAELGLTAEDVDRWINAGRPAYGNTGFTLEDHPGLDRESDLYKDLVAGQKIRNAMFRFVDESVMRPDASQRPGWASDPRWMLFFHLKSFMYSFQETVLKRVIHQVKGKQGFHKLVPLLHLSLLLPATALGLELRELIQYAGSGMFGTPNRTPRTDRMDSFEYMFELVQRTGVAGATQLALDLQAADQRNQFPLLGIIGPTASQAAQLIFDPATQTIPKAIPVVGQIPWMRDVVRQGM